MNIVAVVVYDRIENIKHWFDCWKECEHHNFELILIHNFVQPVEKLKFSALCKKEKIRYIPRVNIGMDIGVFQDVCRERLEGFPNDWDKLLWITDDTFPMSKDFLKPYLDMMESDRIGVACAYLSNEVKVHIRTTGFMIRKSTASQLKFPADPVSTKEHCYDFEHMTKDSFYEQVKAMGVNVRQVADNMRVPLWDSGYARTLNRRREHDILFRKPVGKVLFIATIYNSYPQIISSLFLQTYKNWELLLIHDGPRENIDMATQNALYVASLDKRVKYIETKKRQGLWGHPLRKWALENIRNGKFGSDADYIIITNSDNYYAPPFVASLLTGFTNGQVASYCENMVHSYVNWAVIPCRLQRGFLDAGGVMVRKDIAIEAGWDDMSHSSDWTYFSKIISKYGTQSWAKVRGALFVHN